MSKDTGGGNQGQSFRMSPAKKKAASKRGLMELFHDSRCREIILVESVAWEPPAL